MEFQIINMMLGFLFGLVIGAWLRNSAWSGNVNGPQRILYRKRFYKVIDVTKKRREMNIDDITQPSASNWSGGLK